MSKQYATSRRQILAATSSIAVGSTLPARIAQGRELGETVGYEGISYDPLTHEFQAVARAQVRVAEKGLTGELTVGGFRIPLTGQGSSDTLQPIGTEEFGAEYRMIDQNEANHEDGDPLKVQFTDYGHGMAGLLTRRDSVSGYLAFTLGNAERGVTWRDVKTGLTGNGEGKSDVENKGISEVGLPDRRAPDYAGVNADE